MTGPREKAKVTLLRILRKEMDRTAPEHRLSDFSGDSNADLLAYIALRFEDEASAREALAEFSTRHQQWLESAVARSRFARLLGEETARDIAQETMIRVWERAGTFRATPSDADGDRRLVRAWLGQIANRVGASMLRSCDALIAAKPLPENMESREDPTVPEQQGPNARIVREELDRLSDREKDVVFEWLLHLKLGEEHQRLPNEVSQRLAERWSTTTESIRQIRFRALRTLKEAIARRTGRQL